MVALLFSVSLTGCVSLGPSHFRAYMVEDAGPDSTGPDSTVPVDLEYHGLRLRSGQFIVGDEGDADTLLMSLLSEEYSQYVHAGVIVIENNRPYVYDGYVTVSMFMRALQGKSTGGEQETRGSLTLALSKFECVAMELLLSYLRYLPRRALRQARCPVSSRGENVAVLRSHFRATSTTLR